MEQNGKRLVWVRNIPHWVDTGTGEGDGERERLLRDLIVQLEEENLRLDGEAQRYCRRVVDLEEEVAGLRHRLATTTRELDRLTAQHVVAQHDNSDLVKLYVAHERLHRATTRADVVEAIHEIVVSVIGCEEFALLLVGDAAEDLALHSSMGLETVTTAAELPGGIAPLREVIRGGAVQIGRPAIAIDDAAPMTAAIPLRDGGRTTALLVLYRLLEHKGGLDPLDHVLFDHIAEFGGRALAAAALRAAQPVARPA